MSIHRLQPEDSPSERTLRSKLYFGATVIFFVLIGVGIYHYWTIVHDFFIFPPTTLPPNVLSMLEAEGLSIASDLRSGEFECCVFFIGIVQN